MKARFFALMLLAVAFGCSGGGGNVSQDLDDCDNLCTVDQECVAGECQTCCDSNYDCFMAFGTTYECEAGYCVFLGGQPSSTPPGTTPPGTTPPGTTPPNCVAQTEVCDGQDNDCDGHVDEEVTNACGQCGAVPSEVCNGLDDDCDGQIDEGVLNACGQCGPVPSEVCNGLDDDCNGQVPVNENDADLDGFRICDGDCDDTNTQVNPFATELCNGIDDDCGGQIDEVFFVGTQCNGVGACTAGSFECLDLNTAVCSTMPGGSADMSLPEICGDNVDNDCNGLVDDFNICLCDPSDIELCGLSDVGQCQYGVTMCDASGQWGPCVDNVDPIIELCNGLDDNCDGLISNTENDLDVDGFRVCENDCDDSIATIYPGAPEVCNGLDDDCDTMIDENFFVGAPCESKGLCGQGFYECAGQSAFVCSTAPGGSADASSPEVCSDNLDNDCDGVVDEDCTCEYNPDLALNPQIVCGSTDVGQCQYGAQVCRPDGTWGVCQGSVKPITEVCNGLDDDCDGQISNTENDLDADGFRVCEDDCDDSIDTIYPGAPEVCNGLNDDCDTMIDEDFFVGAPCEGKGECGQGIFECAGDNAVVCSTAPGGSADASSLEVCSDNLDNDCDGSVDEACTCEYNSDEALNPQIVCGSTDVGQCQYGAQDCQPDGTWGGCEGAIEPVPEECNGLDDDCNGVLPVTETDSDADAFMICQNDCDDTNLNVNPSASELCNGADDNCDGQTDEIFFIGVPCTGLGVCGYGVYECVNDTIFQCSTQPGGSADMSEPFEVCSDNMDNDCDGAVDEVCACEYNLTPVLNPQIVCGSSSVGQCSFGLQTCQTDGTWGLCKGAIEPVPETCNGLDDDCDGVVLSEESDLDGDTWMGCAGDCDDLNSNVNPSIAEVCNGVDDDCDGPADEDFYVGVPCEGKGQCGLGTYECFDLTTAICSTMPGGSLDASSPEVCNDNVDNDCDSSVDEGCDCEWQPGEFDNPMKKCGSSDVGVCEYGWQTCQPDGSWGLCEGSVDPGVEACNGLDDDCNGQLPADEIDFDQDGFMVCENDCADYVPSMNPNAEETCNGFDDNCDGDIDATFWKSFYIDVPCIGVGACGAGVYECDGPDDYICSTMPGTSGDQSSTEVCNDLVDNDCDGAVDEDCECQYNADPAFNPQIQCGSTETGECDWGVQSCQASGLWGACSGAVEPIPELCNGLDDDCDSLVPDNELDLDNDGVATCEGDCDDTDPAQSPLQLEVCDGLDNNCNGIRDEGCAVILCTICELLDPGFPRVWYGNTPVYTWTGQPDVCGTVVMTEAEICMRGDHPDFANAGWVDYNVCVDDNNCGGWLVVDVVSCVDTSGAAVPFQVVTGTVDPRAPSEAEIIFTGLCPTP